MREGSDMNRNVLEPPSDVREPMSWVRTRMLLDAELMEWIRHGVSLIAAGFGSFAFLEGLTGAQGEGSDQIATEPSRVFSLGATAIGIILIAVALKHNRNMIDFVNAGEFGAGKVPALPNEMREEYLAGLAIVIGIVSFLALLFLQ
jgi:uncharacterized membrane protein YidH (DUF202 family)